MLDFSKKQSPNMEVYVLEDHVDQYNQIFKSYNYLHLLYNFLPPTSHLWIVTDYHACMLSPSVMSDSATQWTIAHQALVSMEFSRQEY